MEMFRWGIQYKYPFFVREAKKSSRCRVFTAIFVISTGWNQSTLTSQFFGTVKNSREKPESREKKSLYIQAREIPLQSDVPVHKMSALVPSRVPRYQTESVPVETFKNCWMF